MPNLGSDHSIKKREENSTVLLDHSTDFQPQKHRSGYVKPRPAVPEPVVDEDGFTSVVKGHRRPRWPQRPKRKTRQDWGTGHVWCFLCVPALYFELKDDVSLFFSNRRIATSKSINQLSMVHNVTNEKDLTAPKVMFSFVWDLVNHHCHWLSCSRNSFLGSLWFQKRVQLLPSKIKWRKTRWGRGCWTWLLSLAHVWPKPKICT